MAKLAYSGIDGKARKIKKIYTGINGVARKVKKGYIGVDGMARQFFSGETRWERYLLADEYSWNRHSLSNTTGEVPVSGPTSVRFGPDSGGGDAYVSTSYSIAGSLFTLTGHMAVSKSFNTDNGTDVSGCYLGSVSAASILTAPASEAYSGGSWKFLAKLTGRITDYSRGEAVKASARVAGWYKIGTITTCGAADGTVVRDTNPNAYPADGQSGSHWYKRNSGTAKVKGSLDTVVISDDENAYPDNGISGDYWYVKITD